jgi:hypothetical protein
MRKDLIINAEFEAIAVLKEANWMILQCVREQERGFKETILVEDCHAIDFNADMAREK